jgi:hypothetical protein
VGIIELRPQITVSPQEPIEKSNPFSVPFRIDNTGYLAFHVDHVFAYASKIEVGNTNIERATYDLPDWNNFDLGRAESKTVVPRFAHALNVPATADIAIAIDVRPLRWFPRSYRRYFRFTGAYIDTWQWLAEPPAPIQSAADRQIEAHMRQFPSSR